MSLTPKQKQTLDFIKKFHFKNGYMPSLKEIGHKFNIASTSSAWSRVENLIRKGYIIRESNTARGIILTSQEEILNFIRNFNPRLFLHPKRYKSLIDILKEFKNKLK